MKQLFTILFLLFTTFVFSQDMGEKIERVKALRVAYISDRLELTPDEAQKFWPVFNQFDDKQFELNREKRKLMFKLRPENSSNLSEKESAELMAEDDRIETEIQNNKKQLVKNLQGVIPNQKILMLRQIEIEFKQKLLKQIKNRRESRR